MEQLCDGHLWCQHPERGLEILKLPTTSREAILMGAQFGHCGFCFSGFHLHLEVLEKETVERWSDFNQKRISAILEKSNALFSQPFWQHSEEGLVTVNTILEVLSFPHLMDVLYIETLVANAVVSIWTLARSNPDSWDKMFPWDCGQKLAGIYCLRKSTNDKVRRWALITMKALGRISASEYHDMGIGEMLRKWVSQLSTNQSGNLSVIPLLPPDRSRLIRALGDCMEMMDDQSMEQFAGQCPTMFDFLVETMICEIDSVYTNVNKSSSSSSSASSCSSLSPVIAAERQVTLQGLSRSLRCVLRELGGRLWLVSCDPLSFGPLELMESISKVMLPLTQRSLTLDGGSGGNTSEVATAPLVNLMRLIRVVVKAIHELKWRWPSRSDTDAANKAMSSSSVADPYHGSSQAGYVFKQKKPVCVSIGDEAIVPSANATALKLGTETALYCCAQTVESFMISNETEPSKEVQKLHNELVVSICECLMQFYTVTSPFDASDVKQLSNMLKNEGEGSALKKPKHATRREVLEGLPPAMIKRNESGQLDGRDAMVWWHKEAKWCRAHVRYEAEARGTQKYRVEYANNYNQYVSEDWLRTNHCVYLFPIENKNTYSGGHGGGESIETGVLGSNKRRWALGESTLHENKKEMDVAPLVWPHEHATKWSSVLISMFSGGFEYQDVNMELMNDCIKTVMLWHATKVNACGSKRWLQKYGDDVGAPQATEQGKLSKQIDISELLCRPLFSAIFTLPDPRILPVCLHTHMFRAHVLLFPFVEWDSMSSHVSEFTLYVDRLIDGCVQSNKNAALKLLSKMTYDSEKEESTRSGDIMGESAVIDGWNVMRSLTTMSLQQTAFSDAKTSSGFCAKLYDFALCLKDQIQQDMEKKIGEKVEVINVSNQNSALLLHVELIAISVFVDKHSEHLLKDMDGLVSLSHQSWFGWLDALDMATREAGSTTTSKEAASSTSTGSIILDRLKVLDYLLLMAQYKLRPPNAVIRPIWCFLSDCMHSDAFLTPNVYQLLKVFKAYFKDMSAACAQDMLGSFARWASCLLRFLNSDNPSIKKWSSVIVANAALKYLEANGMGSIPVALHAACESLLLPESPIPDNLKQLLLKSRGKSWLPQPVNMNNNQTESDSDDCEVISPPPSYHKTKNTGAGGKALNDALDALIAQEEEEEEFEMMSTKSKKSIHSSKSSAASTSSSSSSGFNTQREGQFTMLTQDCPYVKWNCSHCADGFEVNEYVIVQTNHFHPRVRHLCCVLPPQATFTDVKNWVRLRVHRPSFDRSDIYLRQTQLIVEEAIRLWINATKPEHTVDTYKPRDEDVFVIYQHLKSLGMARVMNSARKYAQYKKSQQALLALKQTSKQAKPQSASSSSSASSSTPGVVERSISGGRGGASQAASQLNEFKRRLSIQSRQNKPGLSSSAYSSGGVAEGSKSVAEHMKRIFDDNEKNEKNVKLSKATDKELRKGDIGQRTAVPISLSASVSLAQSKLQVSSDQPVAPALKLRRQLPIGRSAFGSPLGLPAAPKISLDSFHKQILGWSIDYLLSSSEHVSAAASLLPSSFPNVEWYIHGFENLMYEELRCMVSESVKHLVEPMRAHGRPPEHGIDATTSDVSRLQGSEFYVMKLTTTIAVSELPSNHNYHGHTQSRSASSNSSSSRGFNKRQVGDMLRPSDLILLTQMGQHDQRSFLGLVIDDEVSEAVLQSQQSTLMKGTMAKRDVKVKLFAGDQPELAQVLQEFDSAQGLIGSRWNIVKLESIATISREVQSLYALKYSNHLATCLVTASPTIQNSQDLVSEEFLISLSMRLMREMNACSLDEAASAQQLKAEQPSNVQYRASTSLLKTLQLCLTLTVNKTSLQIEAGRTVIKQIRSLKLHWDTAVAEQAKSVIKQWKDACSREEEEEENEDENSETAAVTVDNKNIVVSGVPERPPKMGSKLWTEVCRQYNSPQLNAIATACNLCSMSNTSKQSPIMLLQGPPGTGKTRTTLAIITALLSKPSNESSAISERLLVCAPSNGAVDEILLRLQRDGLIGADGSRLCNKVLRVGSGSDEVNPTTAHLHWENQVDEKMQTSPALLELQAQEDAILDIRKHLDEMDGVRDARSKETSAHSDKKPRIESDHSEIARARIEKGQLYTALKNAIAARNTLRRRYESERKLQRALILRNASIVLTTNSGAGSSIFEDAVSSGLICFRHVLIDEAAQAIEPSCLIPLRFGCERLIMVGDPRQLPATVKSKLTAKFGLERSLFERLEETGFPVYRLIVQYRFHSSIREFPSARFYENKLQDGANTCNPNGSMFATVPPQACFPPLLLVDLSGTSREERRGTSYFNEAEADAVVYMAVKLLKQLELVRPKASTDQAKETVSPKQEESSTDKSQLVSSTSSISHAIPLAILTPYKEQVNVIEAKLARFFKGDEQEENEASDTSMSSQSKKHRHNDWTCPNIKCNVANFAKNTKCFKCSEIKPLKTLTPSGLKPVVSTVDGFQGQEAEVVLFCCVRSALNGRIGFLSDLRRQNVALTRAKHSLVVFARASALKEHEDWKPFVNHLDSKDLVLDTGHHLMQEAVEAVESITPNGSLLEDRSAYFDKISYKALSDHLYERPNHFNQRQTAKRPVTNSSSLSKGRSQSPAVTDTFAIPAKIVSQPWLLKNNDFYLTEAAAEAQKAINTAKRTTPPPLPSTTGATISSSSKTSDDVVVMSLDSNLTKSTDRAIPRKRERQKTPPPMR